MKQAGKMSFSVQAQAASTLLIQKSRSRKFLDSRADVWISKTPLPAELGSNGIIHH